MKKIWTAIFCMVMLWGGAHAEARTAPIDIAVNGVIIHMDTKPFIENGTTMVPMRFVSEALGYDVGWQQSGQRISVSKGATQLRLQIGSKTAYVGNQAQTLSIAPRIENDRTYLPVRWICETLGAEVDWSDVYHVVSIEKDGVTVPTSLQSTAYTTDEIFWLGRIIEAESAGEILDGKIGVGNVILNRVRSSEYPNTIYGVIFDKKHGVQFQPVMNGAIYNSPSKESVHAAKLSLSGAKTAGECLFFLNPRIATNYWIVNNRVFHKTIGNHDFYL